MVVKRKVALMALHSHLVKTQNYNWANCLLRYLHGYKIDNWEPVSYTHLRAHETVLDLVCRLLLEKKKNHK